MIIVVKMFTFNWKHATMRNRAIIFLIFTNYIEINEKVYDLIIWWTSAMDAGFN